MAGGGFTTDAVGNERADQYKGRVTPYVIIACIVAAIGGSLFGYDVGISDYSGHNSRAQAWGKPATVKRLFDNGTLRVTEKISNHTQKGTETSNRNSKT
ncbi:hypothetical protein RYX36_005170 [Vicia faba]